MILEAWVLQEQHVWRHLFTFGGYPWPLSPSEVEAAERAVEPRMTTAECLDEIEWLLDGGVRPADAVAQVGRTVAGMERAADRAGRSELARRIYAANRSLWEARWESNRRTA